MTTSSDIYNTYRANSIARNTTRYNVVEQKISYFLYKIDEDAAKGTRPFPQTMTVEEFVNKFCYDNSPIGWAKTIFAKAKCQLRFFDMRSGFLGLKKTRMVQIIPGK